MTGPRPCALPADEQDAYLLGECAAFAQALAARDGLGIVVLCYGDPADPYSERHAMAHDDAWAGDAAGWRPLAEVEGDAVGLGLCAEDADALMGQPADPWHVEQAAGMLAAL